ncbi:Gldg family protein [Celerinatantimonas sp. YJH-8]|uniref:Gldg family protein n=1 Tax=Celerinatantimonas sp. YJH-8 TaxID=3228714 RepID=UPI0038C7AD64
MQPNTTTTVSLRHIAGKEVQLFFASPIAYLFLAAFAAITLFIFFWGEAFFARNIADLKPLFEWMPLLLIFLCSTLTMRMWSEERRSGTLEYLLTRPISLYRFVLGKFGGCLVLLLIALIVTLPLPITVSLLGQLDWGPVWSAYLATLLLGASYLAVGLFVSSRCDNQIVSLIVSCAICGVFYLLGSPIITNLFSTEGAHWLRLLGSGSRFDAITRGVLDFRDLYYYISLVVVFLTLNGYMLERERWALGIPSKRHRFINRIAGLLILNVLLTNVWLSQLSSLRIDTTEGKIYTLSKATDHILTHLNEPLLIEGYFSHKTHPLLAPLVPQLENLLQEYAVHGHGKVRVQFADPTQNPEAAKQAVGRYGIHPVPFQVDNRYQSSVVSSYFNVVVSYGDQYKVLNFSDLISAKMGPDHRPQIALRNPEKDLTAAISHVIHDYQSSGNLFNTVASTLTFTGYLSASPMLPKPLEQYRQIMTKTLTDMQQQAKGRFKFRFMDPSSDPQMAQQIAKKYGFKPMATNLLSQQRFYFYMTLSDGQQQVQIPLGDIKGSDFKRNLQAGIKHFAKGFTKTIALVTPGNQSPYAQGPHFRQLTRYLSRSFDVRHESLQNGQVSGDADLLMVMAPSQLDQKQLFAIDQYLMQGGTVIAAASPYQLSFDQQGIHLAPHAGLFLKWLHHMGVTIPSKVVMDPQNTALPIPVTRTIGGVPIQQYEMIDYPYLVDVRANGMNAKNPITNGLSQATFSWASPIQIQKTAGMKVTPLLHSSDQSWLSDETNVMPKIAGNKLEPFRPDSATQASTLGVMLQGRFNSYFAGKASPLLQATDHPSDPHAATVKKAPTQIGSVLQQSADSARLIVFSSPSMARDQVLNLTSSAHQSRYLNTLKLLDNSAHYALEDTALLNIRPRSHFDRTLLPMDHQTQQFWEYLNYALAAIALLIIALIRRIQKAKKVRRYQQLFID